MVKVVSQIEADEREQWEVRLSITSEESEKARTRIRSLEEDLEKAKVDVARDFIRGPTIPEPVASRGPDNNNARQQELSNLKGRARSSGGKIIEEKKQIIEENL